MLPDLNMTGTDYNVALAIFFVPYVLCGTQLPFPSYISSLTSVLPIEVPSNILLAKFKRPSVYLAILTVLWGIIVTLTGVVQSFGALCAVRVLLGIFE
jgi:hypothetical protein